MYPGTCSLFGKRDSLNANLNLLNPLVHMSLASKSFRVTDGWEKHFISNYEAQEGRWKKQLY